MLTVEYCCGLDSWNSLPHVLLTSCTLTNWLNWGFPPIVREGAATASFPCSGISRVKHVPAVQEDYSGINGINREATEE